MLLMKVKNFTIASGTASATAIDNDNAPTVQPSLLLRLLKEVMLCFNTKQPFVEYFVPLFD
jgi:hypothetical protein